MKIEQITEESIQNLVNRFYAKVRKDKNLSPIFINAIGESDEEWKHHLKLLTDFWSSIMLSSRRYKGNPLQKHRDLPAFDPSLFDQWLALFEETALDVYTEELAHIFIERSRLIAKSLKFGLYGIILQRA